MGLWAKWGHGRPTYPLEAHLIDTACFAEALCDRWLPDIAAQRATSMLGVDARRVVVAAAGLHDLGKCSPVFQGQFANKWRDAAGFTAWFASTGLPSPWMPVPHDHHENALVRRHEVTSAAWLSDSDRPGQDGVAALVAGHHGRWRIPDLRDDLAPSTDYYRWLRDDQAWSAQRDDLFDVVTSVCGLDTTATFPSVEAVPVLTGLVVLADWLASALADERAESGHGLPVGGSWGAHREATLTVAKDRVTAWLGRPVLPAGGFSGAFPFIEALRPVQQELLADGPVGLRIVTVPTGDGKTEAALGRWLTASAGRGLFFGLPTMATADAMFVRVAEMFRGTDVFGALAHGRSTLNEFYAPAPSPRFDAQVGHDTDCGGGLRPSSWLVGSRRAMLAPVTVGTADQLLLSVVRHRFGFLRLLGAVGKTVVLDEVHSYDPYMARVLERFLEWAGRWELDVVLLSATLPAAQLRRYVEAYGGDPKRVELAYPSVTTVHADTGATSTAVLARSGRGHTIMLDCSLVKDVTDAAVDRVSALRSAHPDAKIGVMVNTVGRCQDVARRLADAGIGPMMVMHSRFTAARRATDTAEAIVRFGKASPPGPDLLVATQVAEQSMDLDFDVLVTELCPAPSLVQRPGRLHRHDLDGPGRARRRPDGLTTPTMIVFAPAEIAALDPTPWPFLPYTAAEMTRTWDRGLDVGSRNALTVPDDVQDFIDRSHLPLDELGDLDAPDHVLSHLLAEAATRATATDRLVPSPMDVEHQRRAKTLADWCEAPDGVRPSVRLIDDHTVPIILHDPVADEPVPVDPGREQLLELLGRTVPCPVRWLDALAPLAIPESPAGWERTALDDVRIVDLAHTDQLRMDTTLGLIRTKEPQ